MSAELAQAGLATGPDGGPADPAPACPVLSLHARSFKLRFAPQREPGRSYVSLTRPLGLPATVTGKFYCRDQPTRIEDDGSQTALRRIRDTFELGPRERYDAPVTSSQVYGWHVGAADAPDARLQHHVRQSTWMRARLRVLAHDARLKRH